MKLKNTREKELKSREVIEERLQNQKGQMYLRIFKAYDINEA